MLRLIIILVVTFALGIIMFATIKYPDPIGIVAIMVLSIVDTGFTLSLLRDSKLTGEW